MMIEIYILFNAIDFVGVFSTKELAEAEADVSEPGSKTRRKYGAPRIYKGWVDSLDIEEI